MKRFFVISCCIALAAMAQVESQQPIGVEAVAYGVRVDVPAGDVREVLRAVVDAAGLSVNIPGELSGTVSTRLESIPYADAFSAILTPRGYTWRVMPSGLVVIEKSVQRPAVVVALRHRSSADVQALLSKILRQGETVQAVGDELVIEAEPDRCAFLGERIRGLDRSRRQVLVECRFQELSSQASRSLGINWSSLGSYGFSVEPKAIDLGTGQAFGAVLKAGQLAVVMSALDTVAGTRVVSRPTLLASEDKESTVAIGQQYPLPQYTFSQEQSVLQVSGFQFKDIGVLLKVIPRFAGERVVLVLEPEVSSVASTTTFAGAGSATLPVIATRRVKTEVELADGDTMAISGLLSLDQNDSASQVSGLGKVPVLGGLFRSKGKKKDRAELVVFVTVRFVRSAADAVIKGEENDLTRSQ